MNTTRSTTRTGRPAVLTTALLIALTSVSCSNVPQTSSAEPASTAGSPPAGSLPPLSEPGDTVTDIPGSPDVVVSFVVPDGAEEFEDGPGKRAYRVGDGWLMLGAVRAYYTVARNGLLESRDPGNDPAVALEAFTSRDDVQIHAQGQVDVADESALVVGFRTKRTAPDPVSDLWCFQDEISCYKMPVELTANQVVIPWGRKLLVVHTEWEKTLMPPEDLMAARDQLLQSLQRTS